MRKSNKRDFLSSLLETLISFFFIVSQEEIFYTVLF